MSTEPNGSPVRSNADLLTMIGLVVAPAGVGAALLYYFGLLRSRAYFGYFGVDDSALVLAPSEYLSRSVDVVVTPLTLIFVAAGLGLLVHVLLRRILQRAEEAGSVTATRNFIVGAAAFIAALVVFSLAGRSSGSDFLTFLSLLGLAIAILVAEYAIALLGELRAQQGKVPMMSDGTVKVRRVIAGCGIALAVFTAFTQYGLSLGRELGEETADNIGSLRGVVLYTDKQIAINGPGVRARNLGLEDSRFQFRYTGLLFLGHAEGTWILLPRHWRSGQPVIVVPESEDSRLDFFVPE